MKKIGRVGRRLSPWGAIFVVIGLLFLQPGNVDAQSCNWTSGSSSIFQTCGNVGVGTSTPSGKLHIQGGYVTSGLTPGVGNTFYMNATGASPNAGQLVFGDGTGWKFHFGTTLSNQTFAERLTIVDNGNVGIGTTSPGLHLDVQETSSYYPAVNVLASLGARATIGFGVNSTTANTGWIMGQDFNANGTKDFYLLDLTNSATRFYIDTSGHVGIGTMTPSEKLTLAGGLSFTDRGQDGTGDIHMSNNNSGVRIFAATQLGQVPDGAAFQFFGNASPNFPGMGFIDSGASNSAAIIFRTAQASQGVTERMRITAAGNIGIGTTSPQKTLDVAGDINSSGTISGGNVIAKYQDVAEWVPASHSISAGTVVVLDTEHSNQVMASSRAYDTRVAGVVSAKPGVILGEGGEGKIMVATTGRVRVKVDATKAPIRVGDLLVTSDKEGIAMRSMPLDLAGTPIHRPGTLIGKALEPLDKGVGEILVLLSLQ